MLGVLFRVTASVEDRPHGAGGPQLLANCHGAEEAFLQAMRPWF